MRAVFGLALGVVATAAIVPAIAQQANNMTFFVTSVGLGKGADLGGLDGADRYCTSLAQAAGSTGKTWRAYLSTQAADGKPAVNARDRIGKGRGRMRRVFRSPPMRPTFTARTTRSTRRPRWTSTARRSTVAAIPRTSMTC